MKNKTFNGFLADKFLTAEPGYNKDQIEDAFEMWVENLDVQEVCDFAEEWGKSLTK